MILLAAVALVAVAIPLAFYLTHVFRSLELSSVDARFSVRGKEKPPPNLVVVGIDGDTLVKLPQQWPYPRALHAQVIDRLKADGAKVVGFDILFDKAENGPKRYCDFSGSNETPDDCRLLVSTYNAHNLVFSATEVGAHGNTPFLGHAGGYQALEQLGADAGYTGIADDPNGTERRYLYGYSGLPSFAVQLAERTNGKKVKPFGTAWIDYYGGPGTIPEVSYWKVLQGKTPPGYFRGKTVIVGATDPTLKDTFHTSTSGSQLMSGPELQANAVGTVLRGNPLQSASKGLNILLIVVLGLIAPVASLGLRLRGLLVALAAGVAFVIAAQLAFNGGTIIAFVYPIGALLIGSIGSLVVQYFTETRERLRVRNLFSRFVPENVVDEVLTRTDDDLRIGGVQREGTVMFSDLRGFTSFAESLPVERVIEVLNRYLGEMSEAILDNGGTLVAYMGDGIMAVFGAPIEQPDHADRALAAAREMLGPRLARFNDYLREEGLHDEGFRMGVGLNTGMVMSGNVGSERRLEYTAIGDTTNTASRLEGMTKGTPHMLFLADSTRERLHEQPPDLEYVGEFEVRGRTQKIKLWSLADGATQVESAAVGAGGGEPA